MLSSEPVNKRLETGKEAEVCLTKVNIMICMIIQFHTPEAKQTEAMRPESEAEDYLKIYTFTEYYSPLGC